MCEGDTKDSVGGKIVQRITVFNRLEKGCITVILIVMSWLSFSACLYLVKHTHIIYKNIVEDELMQTHIQLTPIIVSSIDEDGDEVKQYFTIPKFIISLLLPFLCLIFGFYFIFKCYTSLLDAIEGQERSVVRFLEYIDNKIERFESIVLVAALAIMLGIYFIQIILQNATPQLLAKIQGGSWMPQIATLMVGVVGFFGASLALRSRQHIKIDLASRILSRKMMTQITVVLDTAGFAISLIFSLISTDYVYFLYNDNSFFTKLSVGTGVDAYLLSIPEWPCKMFIPVAFGILAFRFFKSMVEGLIKTKPVIPVSYYKKGRS